MAQISLIKTPRQMYSPRVEAKLRSGSGIQDILAVLNKDGVEELFDDFHGNSVGHKFFEVTGTGTATYAVSKAVLTTTAADRKTTGLTSNTGWTAGQGCMVQARFMCTRTDNKIFFGFANAEGGADEGVLNNYDTPSFRTATNVIGFGYADADDETEYVLPAYSAFSATSTIYDGSTPAATKITLAGYAGAHGTNDVSTVTLPNDTYTVANTPFVASQLVGQILHVPALPAANVIQRHMMIHANTTSVITGHWMDNGLPPNQNQSYSWGNGPLTTSLLGLAIPVASEYHTFTVKLTPALEAHFYIDGLEMCVLPNAVTASTTSLLPIIECTSSSSTASVLTVDYIQVLQSRRA